MEQHRKPGWFVLKRKQGESFKIGDGIEICVKSIEGKWLSLAIRTDPFLYVYRCEKIDEEKEK